MTRNYSDALYKSRPLNCVIFDLFSKKAKKKLKMAYNDLIPEK